MFASSSSDHSITHVDAGLYKAATNGNFEMFENYTQPLNHLLIGKNKKTILHLHLNSPCKRSREFVENVLGQCPQLLWQFNNDGNIPLHIAAMYDHLEIVKLLIEEAKKPIHRDLENGEEEAVRRMLRSINKQQDTALHLAAKGNYLSLAKEILEHEDPNYTYTANRWGESPLYIATNNEFEDVAMEIVKKFESPNCSGPNGSTAFHAALSKFNFSACWFDLLLSKQGSFIYQADVNGWTPLHVAGYMGYPSVVGKILEKNKLSAYAVDNERNRTAFHMASCAGKVDVMKEIIDKCPECCEITDAKGWNMLHYAVFSGDEEAVKTVMKDSSLVYLINEPDILGYTPWHLLMACDDLSTLISWLRTESAAPSGFFPDKSMSFMFSLERERILEWMKGLGKGPLGLLVVRFLWEELQNKIEETIIPELEKAKDSHLVAAALVATITFAAAFTLPGGYISDENDSKLKGTPILSRNTAFKAFVITNAIAMVLSTCFVFIHFMMVLLGYKQRYYWLMRSAFWFLCCHVVLVNFDVLYVTTSLFVATIFSF